MLDRWLKAQVGVLVGGMLFAWTMVVRDMVRFLGAGGGWGTLTRFGNVAHPLVTPCFYGAAVFAVALAWAIAVLRAAPDARESAERPLAWLLLGGTLFAAGVLAYEMVLYAHPPANGAVFSCAGGRVFPLLTPCAAGLAFYAAAFTISRAVMTHLSGRGYRSPLIA